MDWKTCPFKLAWIVERTITTTEMEMFNLLFELAKTYGSDLVDAHDIALSMLTDEELSD